MHGVLSADHLTIMHYVPSQVKSNFYDSLVYNVYSKIVI